MNDLYFEIATISGTTLKSKPEGVFGTRARSVPAGFGICIVFDVTANTVVISFVFVNYCPNID